MIIDIEEFKALIKRKRNEYFISPYDLIYEVFVNFGYHLKEKTYFIEQASEIIENIRKNSWNIYHPLEKRFTIDILKSLCDENEINKMTPINAISHFIADFTEHIYILTLSNTQSRRSRAGNEFEAIIELIFMGAEIPMDSQGNIGKNIFIEKELGKLVDIVSPGVIEYMINKRNTILISAKTTLRERWQEVPEEMMRTGAREMFLVTLDEQISESVLDNLYQSNINVVTTRNIKNERYKNNHRVLTFEELLGVCDANKKCWDNYFYNAEEKELISDNIKKQILKHENKEFIKKYYQKRLSEIDKKYGKNG
ncbi:type II restriction endonuclease [Mycoplasma bradburyae]|uniref:Restriction endonuclease n=1 Tax=Mycoplasma bradburyae TaxID=2963128 RepID=A0AAW6HQN5_9MOLU|nr:type II restriction endonuclease [Mycoplasma bradburyae]MDC4183729.1 restriction endonuclease [Mycoplasma bradburyae]